MRVRTWVVGASGLLIGLTVGAAGVGTLAARASRLYVQMVRLSFASEEEGRLVAAWKARDLRAAARHAACGVELEGELSSFDPAHSIWNTTFPIVGIWVDNTTKYPVADRTRLLALAHARLGRILEETGRGDEATKEYSEAGRLGASTDVDRWRKAAETVLDGSP